MSEKETTLVNNDGISHVTIEELLHAKTPHEFTLPIIKDLLDAKAGKKNGGSQAKKKLYHWSCDILGRAGCAQCQEEEEMTRMKARNGLHTDTVAISSGISIMSKLQQTLPTLHQMEIRRKLFSGQIATTSILREISRRRGSLEKLTKLRRENIQRPFCCKNSQNFYIDMDDLRRKIHSGAIPKSQGVKEKPSMMEKLFPSFISARNLDDQKCSRRKDIKIEPPLLSINSQNPPHCFFAGQCCQFKQLTPLPENPRYLSAIRSGQSSSL